MKLNVRIELDHVSGPAKDKETMLDCLAATIGKQNGAADPLRLTWTEYDDNTGDEVDSVYEVSLVDDVH